MRRISAILTTIRFPRSNQLHGFIMAEEFPAPGFFHENHVSANITPVQFSDVLNVYHIIASAYQLLQASFLPFTISVIIIRFDSLQNLVMQGVNRIMHDSCTKAH